MQSGEAKRVRGWRFGWAAVAVFAVSAAAFADGGRFEGAPMDGGRGRPGFDRQGGGFRQLKHKLQRLDMLVEQIGPGIDPRAAAEAIRGLDEALLVLAREVQNPPYPPGPGYGPSCDLVGSGAFNGWTYNYRISVNGTVLVGTSDLADLLRKLKELQLQRVCSVDPAKTSCAAGGSGAFAGWSYNYRLLVNGSPIVGASSSEEMIRQYAQLREAGVCSMVQYERCQLLGSGAFAGWSYSNRVAIGGTIVDGANSLEQAIAQMNKLRAGGLCQ